MNNIKNDYLCILAIIRNGPFFERERREIKAIEVISCLGESRWGRD